MSFEQSTVYALGNCVLLLKEKREGASPDDRLSYNLSLVILTCAFLESALNRGLLEAARFGIGHRGKTAKAKLEEWQEQLVEGKLYGDPYSYFRSKNVDVSKGQSRYSEAIRKILSLSINPPTIVSQELADGIHSLFVLRNSNVHGQTLVFSTPVAAQGESAPSILPPQMETVLKYVVSQKLCDVQAVSGPHTHGFLNDAIVDHFLALVVQFLRTIVNAIAQPELQHAFGAGIPQYLFGALAGEGALHRDVQPARIEIRRIRETGNQSQL
jgi:hypothetical protein